MEDIVGDPAYSDYLQNAGYVIWKRSEPNDVYVRADALPTLSRFVLAARTRLLTVARHARRALGDAVRSGRSRLMRS